MFGFYTQPVSLGRGGKEGNNAFTLDEDLWDDHQSDINIWEFVENDPTAEMVKLAVLNKFVDEQTIYDNLHLFARRGNLNVLKQYIKKA